MPKVTSHDVAIHYELHGSGPAVVLAHGAGGNAMSWWQQVPVLSRRHTVVTFDHRGFGRSPCAPEAFQPRRFPDDLCAILDDAGLERAALVCQSMGGWTGMHTALRHPDRVTCLVLCATPGGVFTEEVRASLAARSERFRGSGITENLALAPGLAERDPARAFLYAQIRGWNPPLDPGAFARMAEARIDPAELAGFATPTLVVACELDQLFAPEAIRSVAAAIPGAKLHDFAGVGHSSYFEDAETWNRVVGDFLAEHARP